MAELSPSDIIERLVIQDAQHVEHCAAVRGWLTVAGFASDVRPCRAVLHGETQAGIWCGGASDRWGITIHWSASFAKASVVSRSETRCKAWAVAATPIEALRALVATGKVPPAFLEVSRV